VEVVEPKLYISKALPILMFVDTLQKHWRHLIGIFVGAFGHLFGILLLKTNG
jgi:hypothetical protein